MEFTKEELFQAMECVVNSPFARKVEGVSEDSELSVAKAICEHAATLGTARSEHENAFQILSGAADTPQPCTQAAQEYVRQETEKMEAEYAAAEERWNRAPKIDKIYVGKKQDLIKTKEQEKKEWIERVMMEADSKRKQKWRIPTLIFWVCAFLVALWVIADWAHIDALRKFILNNDIISFGTIFAGVYAIIFLVCFAVSANNQAKREAERQTIEDRYAKTIADLKKDIERGYEADSEFYNKLYREQLKWELAALQKAARKLELDAMKEMAENRFQEAAALLHKTLSNFEALSNWAANYVRDQEQREHNEQILAIERKRLRAQQEAAWAQEEEARKQTELLRDQASAARAQAAAAERQAKDTAEIRRKMEQGR